MLGVTRMDQFHFVAPTVLLIRAWQLQVKCRMRRNSYKDNPKWRILALMLHESIFCLPAASEQDKSRCGGAFPPFSPFPCGFGHAISGDAAIRKRGCAKFITRISWFTGLKARPVKAWAGVRTANGDPCDSSQEIPMGTERPEPFRLTGSALSGLGFVLDVHLGLRASRFTPGFHILGFQPRNVWNQSSALVRPR